MLRDGNASPWDVHVSSFHPSAGTETFVLVFLQSSCNDPSVVVLKDRSHWLTLSERVTAWADERAARFRGPLERSLS